METIIPKICADAKFRIARDGTWFYQGTPIERPEMVKLFARLLLRRPDKSYWLETPAPEYMRERCRVEVEDAPFLAVDMRVQGSGKAQEIFFRTNVDDEVRLDSEHPLTWRGGKPYIPIRGGLEARIAHTVYYELAELALASGENGLRSAGMFFPLAEAGERE